MGHLKFVVAGLVFAVTASGTICRAAEPECTFPDEVTEIRHR
jgi:hypothetical protein